MELIDVPIDLSPTQIRNLMNGKAATLKPNSFNKNSKNVLRLLESTFNRINKAQRNNKGIRIVLHDAEDLISTTKGGKIRFKKAFKDFGKDVKKGVEKAADVVASETVKQSGVVKKKFNEEVAKPMTSKKAMDVYKKIGQHAIEEGIPIATTLASMAMGDPTGMSGAMVGNLASQYASDAYQKKVYKNEQQEGAGLFKALHKAGAHKYGITKTSVRKTAKKIGKQAIDIGADVAGAAIAQYTGNPEAGQMFSEGAKRLGNAAIESKSGKDALRQMKKEAKHIGVELVDDYIDKNLSGTEKKIAQKALAGKYPSAKDLIYDYGNNKIEEAVNLETNPNAFMSGYGIVKVRRGRRGGRLMRPDGTTISMKGMYGGRIEAPSMPSNIIQQGSNVADFYSAQMNNKVMLPSPQLAPPIKKRGGSMYPAGGRPNYGGSFNPSG